MSTPKLVAWSLFCTAMGAVFAFWIALAFVAPRQADARAQMDTLEKAHTQYETPDRVAGGR